MQYCPSIDDYLYKMQTLCPLTPADNAIHVQSNRQNKSGLKKVLHLLKSREPTSVLFQQLLTAETEDVENSLADCVEGCMVSQVCMQAITSCLVEVVMQPAGHHLHRCFQSAAAQDDTTIAAGTDQEFNQSRI